MVSTLKALHSVRAPSRNAHNKAKHRHTGRFCQIFSAFLFLATLNSQFKIVDASQRWFWHSPTYLRFCYCCQLLRRLLIICGDGGRSSWIWIRWGFRFQFWKEVWETAFGFRFRYKVQIQIMRGSVGIIRVKMEHVELFKNSSFDHFFLPRYGNGTSIETVIERRITGVQRDT